MRRVISRVRRMLMARPPLPPEFNADFYLSLYPDLNGLSAEEAGRHYLDHGAAEARSPNLEAWMAGSELPPDFNLREYARSNRDLLAFSDPQLIQHYLEHGAREGRLYRPFNAQLYREQYGRHDLTDAAARRHFTDRPGEHGRIASGLDLALRNGWPGGAWIDEIRLTEFRLLNWRWAGEVATIEDAARRMIEAGIARLAPLSFAQAFDPGFYGELHPELSLADEHLYRDWLFNGCERDEPGNEGEFFRRLGLNFRAFPAGFRWREYLRSRPGGGTTRWSALQYFMTRETSPKAPPCDEEGAVEFLKAAALELLRRDPLRGIAVMRAARERGRVDAEALEALGSANHRAERWEEALEAFQSAAASGRTGLVTSCDGARTAIALDRLDAAFDFLSLGQARFSSTPWWRHALEETIEAEFEAARGRARTLYAAGDRIAADARMVDAVHRCRQRWSEFDPIGTPVPAAADGRVVILAETSLEQCRHYRVQQKAEMLEALGRPFEIYTLAEVNAFVTALPGCAAAIIYRAPATPKIIRALEAARRLSVKTFYDIDDLIFDSRYFPEPLATYGGEITRAEHEGLQSDVPLVRCAMAMCEEGISSTESLATHMREVVRSGVVHVLPNGIDSLNAGFLDAPPRRVRRDDEVLIFYGSGTRAHNSDFVDLAAPALQAILRDHRGVRLILAGHVQTEGLFDDVAEQVTRVVWTSDLEAYWSLLSEVDINLAVLARTPSTDAKSEIKWLEAAALGIPSVVSDTATYREVLHSGDDSLLVATPQDWLASLRQLVEDASLRERIGGAAREAARSRYTLDRLSRRLDDILPAVSSAKSSKPRILIVNVFFPPQTVGGATRVVRDNVDELLAGNAAEIYEFAVATTDLEEPSAYNLRVDTYKGVPVFRFSTPQQAGMDWRPFDLRAAELFERILDSWRPDIVHFHCIQRISASALATCAKRDISYLVTLHDAWWLADHSFLVDEAFQLVDSRKSIAPRPTHEVATGASVLRRRELAALLDGAARLLAVSETFADIYRRSGFPQTVALSNGVPAMAPVVRLPSKSGRVRLTHVGSKSYHKGYLLLQATLMQGRFPNLELTVVEHERVGGLEYGAVWGETPVRFVGKTRQEDMHLFYGQQDVLVAPSMWPESFGLVSREALAAGLWVIASDRGAIGENVSPGVNGWIIDVGSPAALDAVLTEINADAARYTRSPPPIDASSRTSADQARDLLAIYQELAGS